MSSTRLTYGALLLLPALLLSSCSGKDEPEYAGSELCISAWSSLRTKGYVESTALAETSEYELHTGGTASPRTLYLTSWYYPTTKAPEEYFRGQVFQRDAGSASDGLWHRADPVYWPLDGKLDMIAYSCTNAFPESSVDYSRGTTTDELLLAVDRSYSQDDILFSFAGGVTNNNGHNPTVQMVFKHAQAWIEFVFHTSIPALNNIIKINKVELRDIYMSGILSVRHPYAEAEGKWSFRYATRHDETMDDNSGIYGQWITTERKYLDMLVPEQGVKDFVLYYEMDGGEPEMLYVGHLSGYTWEMGKKYIYDITFSPTQITVSSSITDWKGQDPVPIDIP